MVMAVLSSVSAQAIKIYLLGGEPELLLIFAMHLVLNPIFL